MRHLRHLPRSFLTLVVGMIATILAAVTVVIIARIAPTSPWLDRVARVWSRAWLVAAGVDLDVRGSVDFSRSYVVVANHVSNLDVMACFLAVPIPIRFLAKKELFQVPLLASAMRSIGIIEVDRKARTPVHDQVNRQARSLVESGRSLIIYAEGTRSRVGEMAPFKKGAFTMAVAAQLPVLPVTIHGTYEAWPPASPWVRGGPVQVVVDAAIETAGLTQADTTALRDRAQAVIDGRHRQLTAEARQ